MTELDLPALLGEHPRRDSVVVKLARFMQPNDPTVANLVRLVKANAKGWSYRSGLSDPDRLFIVDALAKAGLIEDTSAPPPEPTTEERRLWGKVRQALIDGRRIEVGGELARVHAALGMMGGRAEVIGKLGWKVPPDMLPPFVQAYRAAVAAGVTA